MKEATEDGRWPAINRVARQLLAVQTTEIARFQCVRCSDL